MKIGISACLMADKVRYDGKAKTDKELIDLLKSHEVIKICPEISSGFSVPRKPIEKYKDRIIDIDNNDLTDELYEGSMKCYEMIKDCDFIILKDKSPSCGYGHIYDGHFNSNLIEGNGMFAQICLNNNITIYNEKDIDKIKELLSQ